jgi:hypothetical protein
MMPKVRGHGVRRKTETGSFRNVQQPHNQRMARVVSEFVVASVCNLKRVLNVVSFEIDSRESESRFGAWWPSACWPTCEAPRGQKDLAAFAKGLSKAHVAPWAFADRTSELFPRQPADLLPDDGAYSRRGIGKNLSPGAGVNPRRVDINLKTPEKVGAERGPCCASLRQTVCLLQPGRDSHLLPNDRQCNDRILLTVQRIATVCLLHMTIRSIELSLFKL